MTRFKSHSTPDGDVLTPALEVNEPRLEPTLAAILKPNPKSNPKGGAYAASG